jgi:hypothetical protein
VTAITAIDCGGSGRDLVWIEHRGQTVARYPRSYTPGRWQPAPRMRSKRSSTRCCTKLSGAR